MNFDINLPEKIHFYRQCRFALPGILPAGNVLFICGKHAKKRIQQEMLPLLADRKVIVSTAFSGEPLLSEVEEVLSFARKENISAVIGWGGGSAMDGAKAVAALLHESGSVADHFYGKVSAGERKVFFAALPTTAGTGAEVTANAVLTDSSNGIKQSLRTPGMAPDAAFVDPELVAECPFSVMAASGFDALTQAIEGFISRKATTLTKSFARSAFRDILLNLEDACNHNQQAVDAVTQGSLNAGIGLSKSGLGAVHGIGHPLGSLLHIPHGVCCGTLLVEVLRFNAPVVQTELDELAHCCGEVNGNALIEKIANLRQKLGVPADFKQYHLERKHFDFIVRNCRSGSMKSNPRNMSDGEVIQLLEKML